MIGIGTPRSQSRMPRPMALSFQPAFPRMYIAHGRVWFPRAAGSLARSECRTEPRRTRRRTRGRVGIPRPAGFVRIFEPPGPVVRSPFAAPSGSSAPPTCRPRWVRSVRRVRPDSRTGGFVRMFAPSGPVAPPGSFGSRHSRVRPLHGAVGSAGFGRCAGLVCILELPGSFETSARHRNLPRNWRGAAPRFRDRRATDRRAARHVR
jgi:hypothetical protein